MRTSHILFASTVLMAALSIVFQASIGSVKTTHDNQPIDTLSALWMKRYNLKVTQKLPQPVKYLKLIGKGTKSPTYISVEKTTNRSLFSISPQNFTHDVKNDTLFIYTSDTHNNIHIRQPEHIEQITVHQGNATITGISQDRLMIDVQKGSRLNLGNRWYSRKKVDSIFHLDLHAKDRSNISLNKLKMKTAVVKLENAVLNYNANVEADSLLVTLKERSTVASQNRDVVNQINNLTISGNKHYYTKELVGKDVDVMLLP